MADLWYFLAVRCFVREIVPEVAGFLLVRVLQIELFLQLLLGKFCLALDDLPVTHVIEDVKLAQDIFPAEVNLLLLTVHAGPDEAFPGLVVPRDLDIVIRRIYLRQTFLRCTIDIIADLRW